MSPKGKKILIVTSVVLVLGVGGYLTYRWLKKSGKLGGKKEDEKPPVDETGTQTTPSSSTTPSSTTTSSSTTSTSTSSGTTNPFKTKDEVKRFQDWLDKNYPTWLNGGKLNGGSGYGSFGQNTSAAWDKYGSVYVNRPTTAQQILSDTTAKKFRNIYAAKDGVRAYKELKKGTQSWNYYKKGDVLGKSMVTEEKLTFPKDLQIELVSGDVGKGNMQYIKFKTEYNTVAYVSPSDVKVGTVLQVI